MRLVKIDNDGRFILEQFPEHQTPPYAILSHTWGRGQDDEVTYRDIINGTGGDKPGYKKLEFCSNQATADGLQYFWVDTCAINKDSEPELTTAINSMFRWYQNATKCYVYLSDVSIRAPGGLLEHSEWASTFRGCQWFTRGWTLQELLAPRNVTFYSKENLRLGDKITLENQITSVTGIATEALQGQPLANFSIEDRLRWAEKRETTREEDKAYCLLGIFNIFLPLIYGEGHSSAMRRLIKEVKEVAVVSELKGSSNVSPFVASLIRI
jgi:hypothetical protein